MRWLNSFIAVFLVVLGLPAQQQVAMVKIKSAESIVALDAAEQFTTSFSLQAGKILVELLVNGSKGNYLVDTGADAFLINAIPSETNAFEAVGLTGTAHAELTTVDELIWGKQQYKELAAYKVDLSRLESAIGIPLDGVIGQSLLGLGALHIDYHNQQLTFMPSPKARVLKKAGWKAYHLYQIDHLLTLAIKVNGQKLFMGLDTGAEINLVAKPLDLPLQSNTAHQIVGINGQSNTAHEVDVRLVEMNKSAIEIGALYYSPNETFDQRFDGELSGLLGFPFFENNVFVLDMVNKILYLR